MKRLMLLCVSAALGFAGVRCLSHAIELRHRAPVIEVDDTGVRSGVCELGTSC